MHIACAEGHLQIVEALLVVNSSICYTHDQDGKTPVHVAAINGKTDVLRALLNVEPQAARERTMGGESVLHLCVKHKQGHLQIVEALLVVNSSICYTHDQDGKTPVHVAAINGQIDVLRALLNVEPQAARERTMGGESVLHLCVKHKQPEALRFLVKTMDDGELLNLDDALGNTVLHLAVAAKQSERSRKDVIQDDKLWQHLNRANALPAKEALKPKKDRAWLEDQRTSLMVVASLIATMAFQAGINPPGGVWQDDLAYSGTIGKTTRKYIGHDAELYTVYQRHQAQATESARVRTGEENTSEKVVTLSSGSELTNEVVKEGGVVQCNEQIIVPIMSTNPKDIADLASPKKQGRKVFKAVRTQGKGHADMETDEGVGELLSGKRKAGVQFTGELMEQEGYTLKRVKGTLDNDELSVFNQVAEGRDVQPREEQ
uniref:PGG domain-containing protein n=1 Tax=Chenopodium quinoa TaxID=63459 RepID=A0A803NCF1_CHEQI